MLGFLALRWRLWCPGPASCPVTAAASATVVSGTEDTGPAMPLPGFKLPPWIAVSAGRMALMSCWLGDQQAAWFV